MSTRVRSAKSHARVRMIMLHCKDRTAMVDAFHCSACEWSYTLQQPEPFLIAPEGAEDACRKFDQHRCEEFQSSDLTAIA